MSSVPHLPSPDIPSGFYALFLDIDGTLLEHAEHPDAVSVSPELLGLVERLEARLDGALAFVTGRSVAQADHLFSPLLLRTAGLYGLEHRMEAGGLVEPAVEPPDITALALELQSELADPLVYIERKGPALAVHTRAAPHLLNRAIEIVEAALDTLPTGYRMLPGNAGVELMPLAAVKGAAIRRFMQAPPFFGRTPWFLGDDTSDEHGFAAVNELGGVSVRVKPRGPTVATHVLSGVPEVLDWLREQDLG